MAGFDEQEGGDEGAERGAAGPAGVSTRGDAVNQGEQTAAGQDCAGYVEPGGDSGAVPGQQNHCAEQDERPEEHHDQHGPAPAEAAGDEAAADGADDEAEGEQGAVDREGLGALRSFTEGGGHQGDGGGADHRGGDALAGTGRDEDGAVGCESADEGQPGEHDDAQDEQAASAYEVRDAAEEQEEARGGQQAGGGHPLQVAGGGEVQVAADLGERHRDDREVQRDQKGCTAQRDQGEPAPRA